MIRILADHDIEGQAKRVWDTLTAQGWHHLVPLDSQPLRPTLPVLRPKQQASKARIRRRTLVTMECSAFLVTMEHTACQFQSLAPQEPYEPLPWPSHRYPAPTEIPRVAPRALGAWDGLTAQARTFNKEFVGRWLSRDFGREPRASRFGVGSSGPV